MDCAQLANTAASGLVALACLTFGIVYHRYAPWRSTSIGRHVMTFTLAIGALGAYTVLITIWPQGLIADILRSIRTLLLFVIAVLVVQRTRMVVRAQHDGDLHQAAQDPSGPPT